MTNRKVVLFFRKSRDNGNYSIEASFDRMVKSLPRNLPFTLTKFASSYVSNGLFRRLLGILEARRVRADVNHVTGDVHYLVLGLPRNRTVLTIHDCGFMNQAGPIARRLLKWLWLDLPVRHCRLVTAVSEATKQDIIRYTGCAPDKIAVIPTVISNSFHRTEREFDEAFPRILHVGLAPNKNFARHVEAIAGLDCRLHIVGKLETEHVRVLEENRVRYTAEYNISGADMQRAYAASDLLLFASTLEGFGMPILEAQTVGRPVVTSNLSSMPWVAGDAAVLVDPYSVESIRQGVRQVIGDRALRERLIQKGFENVRRFDAEYVAQEYVRIYEAVAESE